VANPNAFALKNSELNTFLFADIGTEMNGSDLTMLSMLARLGQDPWAEAGRLSRLPQAEAFKSLVQSLGKMPLSAQGASGISATASRLLALLPGKSEDPVEHEIPPRVLHWLPVALFGLALSLGLMAVVTRIPLAEPAPSPPAAVPGR
jgi:hypothetical protein